MNLRHLALAVIALPISIAIGGTLRTVDAAPAAIAAVAGADAETVLPTRPEVPLVRVSRRDAAALRAGLRRPVTVISRLVPLAQADDSSRWR